MRLSINRIFFSVTFILLGASATVMCSESEVPFDETAEITDPYCVDTPNWREEFSVSAAYSKTDPNLLAVVFEPSNQIVDMNGLADVKGADIDSITFDAHTLILVLLPHEDSDTITIRGAVDCTTLSQFFEVTLFLSSTDNSVAYEITYIEDDNGADAGDNDDAGV